MGALVPIGIAIASAAGAIGTAAAAAAPTISVISGVVGGAGAVLGGLAKGQSDAYQAKVADYNATIADQNARWAAQQGDVESADEGLKTKSQVASSRTQFGASGIDVGTGSAANVQTAEQALGGYNALTIRSNAARQTFGYQQQAASLRSGASEYGIQSTLDPVAGLISGVGSFLGGVSSAGSQASRLNDAGVGGNGTISTAGL